MTIVPTYGHVLLKQLNSSETEETANGISFNKKHIPLYEICALGQVPDTFRFHCADKVICKLLPEKIVLESGIRYLTDIENIIGKVQ